MIGLIVAASLFSQAESLVESVDTCDLRTRNEVVLLKSEALPDAWEKRQWDELYLRLADRYLAIDCPGEAEAVYDLLIRHTQFDQIRVSAQAGLQRALARH